MVYVVDTCGWIEWLTDGILTSSNTPRRNLHNPIR